MTLLSKSVMREIISSKSSLQQVLRMYLSTLLERLIHAFVPIVAVRSWCIAVMRAIVEPKSMRTPPATENVEGYQRILSSLLALLQVDVMRKVLLVISALSI